MFIHSAPRSWSVADNMVNPLVGGTCTLLNYMEWQFLNQSDRQRGYWSKRC